MEAVAAPQLCFKQFQKGRLGENLLGWALICQNSHLQLKIKTTGTCSSQAIIKRRLATFLACSGFCIKTSCHFEIFFSYVSFFSGHKVPKTKIVTFSTFLIVIWSSNTTALFQFLKTDWFEHFMFYYTRAFYYTYIFY